ncbi:MAG TPA: carbonic anhydrase [Methylomirabilota bacterium]|nr:carbonic anhydrase [Methylomirabilota bacterium]
MERLIQGVLRFQSREVEKHLPLFKQLAEQGQQPHTLFITCSDSRVVAELITSSRPGEIFVVKNVGNIVPPPENSAGPNSTAAAIEFAINNLKVPHIVVCGHTCCGAMQALLQENVDGSTMPHLKEWLDLVSPVRATTQEVSSRNPDAPRETIASEQNVLFGLETLKKYTCVKEAVARGSLLLHGWLFDIAKAEVSAHDPQDGRFKPIQTLPKSLI